MITKTLKLTSVSSTATTYAFRAVDGHGWALCTINDATGELSIVSDYGTWSYRWHASPSSLGNATLTHFIGDRSAVDYLVDKLAGRRAQEFDADATTTALRKLLVERRYKHGHEMIRREIKSWECPETTRNGDPHLTKGIARELWNELRDLANDCGRSAELYIERMSKGMFEHIEEPWSHLEEREPHMVRALREVILPALVAACGDRVKTEPHYIQLRAEFDERAAEQVRKQAQVSP